jgi:hypothetical protein
LSGLLARLIEPAIEAVQALSLRARYGAVALIGLAAIYAQAQLETASRQVLAELAQTQRQLAARQATLGQADWASLAGEAEALSKAAEARFWRAATPGIAAAQLQGALEAAAREAGLDEPRVRVIESGRLEAGAPDMDIRLFEAELTARDTGGAFAPLIEAAAGAQGDLRAIRLDWDGANRRFTLVLLAPVLIEAGG